MSGVSDRDGGEARQPALLIRGLDSALEQEGWFCGIAATQA
jgi:hypothetical protein